MILYKGGFNMEKTKEKKKRRFISIFFILIIGIGIFLSKYYKKSLGPVSMREMKDIVVEVPAGSSTNRIAQILFDSGLIHNKSIFKYQVKKLEVDGKLRAGIYELNTTMDLDEIIENIVKGGKSNNGTKITIPEGYELDMIAKKLSDEGIVDYNRFLKLAGDKKNFEDKFAFLKELDEGQSLEGFLYPSTYEVLASTSEEEVIEKMLSEFEKIYRKDIEPKLKEMNMSLNEVVTLASIIEREGKLDRERPIMSAVFHNRIKKGMHLQSCATVQYILGERKARLTDEETSIPSPYNTYVNGGLPPGPIASPGEPSIVAAVNPSDVDYLFFVLTGDDGSHTFTMTYDEHLRAKPKSK